jgi:thioredoxin-related protein
MNARHLSGILFAFALTTQSVAAQQWNKNLEAALREAGVAHKQVLLVFSVPGNCALCDDLESEVFNTKAFVDFAAAHYVLARPDFSAGASYQSKADNLMIVEKYDKDGFFPWLVVLNADGKIAGRAPQYDHEGADAYISQLNKIPKD